MRASTMFSVLIIKLQVTAAICLDLSGRLYAGKLFM